jgi:hypothetical protein
MNATTPTAAVVLDRAADVATIAVIHMSDDLRTSLAIGPAELEAFPDVVRHLVTDRPAIDDHLAHLRATPFASYDGAIDLRWSLTYADADGKTIGSVYADRFGLAGYVGNRPAEFDDEGAFGAFLRATYPD